MTAAVLWLRAASNPLPHDPSRRQYYLWAASLLCGNACPTPRDAARGRLICENLFPLGVASPEEAFRDGVPPQVETRLMMGIISWFVSICEDRSGIGDAG